MSMYDTAEEAIDAYVTQTLTTRQRTAISVCNTDLYFGPYYSKSGRSRWEMWSPVLAEALDNFPSELWYDAQSGEVLEREPEWEKVECMECDGDGVDRLSYDDTPCPVCEGTGKEWIEPFLEDFYYFDSRAVKRAVLGKELAAYF